MNKEDNIFTDEEKKAIEVLNEILTHKNDVDIAYGYNIERPYPIGREKIAQLEIIKNLLEKQQKEIERLENKDKEYMNIENNNLEYQEKYKEALKDKCKIADKRNQLLVENQKKNNTIKNLESRNRKLDLENQKLFEQIIFQDKVIDELLNKLNQDINYFSDEENSEFIKIYENIKDKTELKGRKLRKYCIEQYFIKKVEEQE